MKFILILYFMILTINPCLAKIHNKTAYFIDIELDKKHFLITCSDHPEDNTSYIAFNLLDGDTYYFFVYLRPLTPKMCKEEKEEYLKIVRKGQTVRLVGHHPDEELITEKKRKEKYPKGYLPPFKYAKKVVTAPFARLQGEKGGCKAYFEDDCDLPKNYWVGVAPK